MHTLKISLQPMLPSFGEGPSPLFGHPCLEQPLGTLAPVLKVNGLPLFTPHAVVDTFELLSGSTTEGEFELLTCHCGDAAGAGLERPVRTRLAFDGEPLLSWLLPASGYAPYVHPGQGPGPWQFVFALNAVLKELEGLEAQMRAIVRRGPLHLTPCHGRNVKLSSSTDLERALALWRAQRLG